MENNTISITIDQLRQLLTISSQITSLIVMEYYVNRTKDRNKMVPEIEREIEDLIKSTREILGDN